MMRTELRWRVGRDVHIYNLVSSLGSHLDHQGTPLEKLHLSSHHTLFCCKHA